MALIKSKQITSLNNSKIVFDQVDKQFLTDAQIVKWDAKYDAELVTIVKEGLMSAADKVRIDAMEDEANNYIHPDNHPAAMITQTNDLKFVSQTEKNLWSDKYTQTEVDNMISSLQTGLEWKESVSTKDDIVAVYPSPAEGYVVSVDDENGQTYRYNGTEWVKFLSLVYTLVTQADHGLMSAEDKIRLDNMEDEANKYIHPSHHLPSIITQDENNRFVTDNQIDYWDAKAENVVATELANGLMSAEDKRKLNAGVTQQKSFILNIGTNGQTVIATGVSTDDSLAHKTNVVDGQVSVNGMMQVPGADYIIQVNGSNEVEVKWLESANFTLETSDVLIFTFSKLL